MKRQVTEMSDEEENDDYYLEDLSDEPEITGVLGSVVPNSTSLLIREKTFERGRITNFQVFTLPDIVDDQKTRLREIQDLTGIDPGRCQILLRHYNWNVEKLTQKLLDDPDRFLFH